MSLFRGAIFCCLISYAGDPTVALASSFGHTTRVGVSLGSTRAGGASISIDSGSFLSENATLGGEIYGLKLIGMRVLIWEQPSNMSGFNGGAKLYMGLGSPVAVEAGAEFGWNYRFKNKVDIGAGVDLVVAESIGGTLKFTAGLLF
jgi:hypothetical protein